MGRKAYFTNEAFINAAVHIIAKGGLGALTIAALAKRIKAPIGSVYHRFPSRDALLAELWLNIVESYQSEFLKLLQEDGLQATLSSLHWVRDHPNEARVLLLYRVSDLASGKWPHVLKKRARHLSDELNMGIVSFTKRHFGSAKRDHLDRVIFAIHDAPIGLFRRYLQDGEVPPESAAVLIRETYNAIIEKSKTTDA